MADIMGEFIQTQEDNGWSIKNDVDCEWALLRVKEDREEKKRLINVCDAMIQQYQKQKKDLEGELNTPSFLEFKLQEYFESVPHKKTKAGTESYSLPSGKLKLKPQQPEYKRDESTLLQWLKDRQMNEYIKVSESAQWGELKKATQTVGDKVVIDGELVEGIEVVERPPVFEVEI